MKPTLVVVVLIAAIAFAIVATQTGERQVSLIVTNGIVVTMDAERRVIANGAVAVDGADIVAVDTTEIIRRQYRGAERQDAGRRPRPCRDVHHDVQRRSTDYAGGRAARHLHARRGDADGGAQPGHA